MSSHEHGPAGRAIFRCALAAAAWVLVAVSRLAAGTPATLHDDGTFEYGQLLQGKISGGDEHGVQLTRGIDGNAVTKPMCLNLEHYFSTTLPAGFFVPRRLAPLSIKRIADDTMRVEIEPHEQWRVRTQITYRLLPDCLIEAEYALTFEADYSDFEGFVSNYFYGAWPPVLHLGGRWAEGRLDDPAKEHRWWCRSPADRERLIVALAQPGRKLEGFETPSPVDEACVSEPILVTFIGASGYAVIHWVERDNCPSISANQRWGAHDFSLIGRDVKSGETVRCRAWMAYRKLDRQNIDEALVFARTLK